MTRRAWTAFATLSLVWGVPYLLIKVAVDAGISPAFVAWARTLLAAAVLLPLAWRAGSLRALRGKGRWLLLFALLQIVIPFPLIAAGEQRVDSSLAAILIAATPLMVAALAPRFDHTERVEGVRFAGLVVGFVGVIALVGIDVGGRGAELLGAGAILLAALGYAGGPLVLNRHLSNQDPRATMGVSLAIAAVVLTPFAALSPPHGVPSTSSVLALIGLGLVCTALAFVTWSVLITEVGAGRALVVTYVNPAIAVALGAVILGEHPGAGAIVGLLLILAGSWLSTDGRLPPGLARRIRAISARQNGAARQRLGMMSWRPRRSATPASHLGPHS